MISGSLTALVTPFAGRDHVVDEAVLAALVGRQVALGADGLVVAGVTGEAPTLTLDERERVVRTAVEVAAGQIPVIAGVVANATDAAIADARNAKAAGADAALVTTPYYNKPGQEGLFRHFEAIARAVDIPLILSDAPDRCMVGLAARTVERLATIPAIIGIEDASGDPTRPWIFAEAGRGRLRLLCGYDARAVEFHLAGGHGCISATANIVPGLCAALQRACVVGGFEEARSLQAVMRPLDLALALGPAAVKSALAHACRLGTPDVRPPVIPIEADTADAILAALAGLRRLSIVEHALRFTRHRVPRTVCMSSCTVSGRR